MDLGIDLGTSSVKAVLIDDEGRVAAQGSSALPISRPRPLWSEQNPEDWWGAAGEAVRALDPFLRRRVRALGLTGQMHGAILLDDADQTIRPAILWNDGRAFAECAELERREPRTRQITGNKPMAGFTAPKLLWVARHEPEALARTRRVLLPKDWLRLRLTGEAATDASDAAGTLWLDLERRTWSEAMLAACDLSQEAMPKIVEGPRWTGRLRADAAAELGLPPGAPVAAGAGDNAAGAVGIGAAAPGRGTLSLGTSGVYFLPTDRPRAAPESGVHAFCHALPGRWHQMAVILSAASSLSWIAALTRFGSVEAALGGAAEVRMRGEVFLPYLAGERTPHDDPHATGVFYGLSHDTDRAALVRAVLEGVAFALADGQAALLATGSRVDDLTVIGGAARSPLWGAILASALGRPLTYRQGGEIGPALGAARLARMARLGIEDETGCPPPPASAEISPEPELAADMAPRQARFATLYPALKAVFQLDGAPT